MKLAEALVRRAEAQKRIQHLRQRLAGVARIQEGDRPAEDPKALLKEIDRTLDEFTRLVQLINRTNQATEFAGSMNLSDALAQRDRLELERAVILEAVKSAAAPIMRGSRNEVRFVATVNIAELQKRADDLAHQRRDLDTQIQSLNWQIDLVD